MCDVRGIVGHSAQPFGRTGRALQMIPSPGKPESAGVLRTECPLDELALLDVAHIFAADCGARGFVAA